MPSDGVRSIKSVEHAFDIVEIIQQNDGARLSEIADILDKSPSTLHQYLQTLLQEEFLGRVGKPFRMVGTVAETKP